MCGDPFLLETADGPPGGEPSTIFPRREREV
jgi:hypothetical protein